MINQILALVAERPIDGVALLDRAISCGGLPRDELVRAVRIRAAIRTVWGW